MDCTTDTTIEPAENIPDELKRLNQWVVQRDKKMPTSAITGKRKEWQNNLASYGDAVVYCEGHPGYKLGFAFSPDVDVFGIDLDSCRNPETEIIEEWAEEIIQRFGTYAEISQSGTGVKLIGRGSIKRRTVHLDDQPRHGDHKPHFEIFRSKYFALTGDGIEGLEGLSVCDDAIEWLEERYPVEVEKQKPVKRPVVQTGGAAIEPVARTNSDLREKAYKERVADFNQHNDPADLLIEAGYKPDGNGNLVRPGKHDDGHSVTIKNGRATFWSSECHPFKQACAGEKASTYDAWSIRVFLKYNGNFTEAQKIEFNLQNNPADMVSDEEVASIIASGTNGQATKETQTPFEWGEPIMLDSREVQQFPTDLLPSPLREWVHGVAEETQTPPSLAGLLGLAICSGAVARRVAVEPQGGWTEPVNLYVACILEPGNRKSAVFKKALKPIKKLQQKMADASRPAIAIAQQERKAKQARLTYLEKQSAKGDGGDSMEEQTKIALELATERVVGMPVLYMDDATPEAIEKKIGGQQESRMIVAGCEGGVFEIMAGRYSGGSANLDVFLKGHAGDDLRSDRITRGSVSLDNLAITMAYAVQPEVIRGMAEKSSFRGKGLIGRILYAVPESPVGSREIEPPAMPESIQDAYDDLVARLDTVLADTVLRFDPSAKERFIQWQSHVEVQLREFERMGDMVDWGSKLCGLSARIAAIMHLIQDQDAVWIDLETTEAAIELATWAIPHAEQVISMMGAASEQTQDGKYILRWLKEKGLTEFSQRDAQNRGRSRFDGLPERLSEAIQLLVDTGWIRLIPMPSERPPGRPPSPRFEVNPRVHGDKPTCSD